MGSEPARPSPRKKAPERATSGTESVTERTATGHDDLLAASPAPVSESSSMISTYTPSGLRTHPRRAPVGPIGSLSGEPRPPSRVSVWSKSATHTPIRAYPMSQGLKSCASLARGRSNWNISSWKNSLRSTIHQHVEATRGRACTADASRPRISRREPPAGQNPSPNARPPLGRYQIHHRERHLAQRRVRTTRRARERRDGPASGVAPSDRVVAVHRYSVRSGGAMPCSRQ